METRVNDPEEELSSTIKQHEEANSNEERERRESAEREKENRKEREKREREEKQILAYRQLPQFRYLAKYTDEQIKQSYMCTECQGWIYTSFDFGYRCCRSSSERVQSIPLSEEELQGEDIATNEDEEIPPTNM